MFGEEEKVSGESGREALRYLYCQNVLVVPKEWAEFGKS